MLARYTLSACVCLSQVGVLLNRLNIRESKQRQAIAQELYSSDAKDLREIRPRATPNGGAKHSRWSGLVREFRQTTRHISKTVQDRRTVSVKVE